MASTFSYPCGWKYNVFISFRGVDVRDGFLSHLSEALCNFQITVFTDESLERGEEIAAGISRRIEQSHVSIVILSENYAYSSWCLDELVKIMDCKKGTGQTVIPVFYRIDQTHVRKLTGTYGDALVKHAKRYQDKVESWSLALKETTEMRGFDSHHLKDVHLMHCVRDRVIDCLPAVINADIERSLPYRLSYPYRASTTPIALSYVDISPSYMRIPVLTFVVDNANTEKYREFIEALRTQLSSEDRRPDGIRVMPRVSTINKGQRILLVSILSSETTSATFVLDRSDAYIVGYMAQNQYYLLELDGEKNWFYDVFQGSEHLSLGFSYDALEKSARVQSRSEIDLGIKHLKYAIACLHNTKHDNVDYKMVANSLIICIQMISEAARFKYIETQVCGSICDGRKIFYKSFNPDKLMLKLQKDWGSHSTVAQIFLPHVALIKYKDQVDDHEARTSNQWSAKGKETASSSQWSAKGKETASSSQQRAKGKGTGKGKGIVIH